MPKLTNDEVEEFEKLKKNLNLRPSQTLTLEHFINTLLQKREDELVEKVEEVVRCKDCEGEGGILDGKSLGFVECERCGGSGYYLYSDEDLPELINLIKNQ